MVGFREEVPHQFGLRLGRHDPVGLGGGQRHGIRSADAHHNWNRLIGQIVELGMIDDEVLAPHRVHAAAPQRPEDVDRLAKHVVAL